MIYIIAAMDHNRLIGMDNSLPWNIPADLFHFKERTLNHPIVMGRKTYESLPLKPLPKRTNIVISSHHIDGDVHVYDNLQDGIDYGLSISKDIYVIGGAMIYEQALSMADRLVITWVNGSYVGNKFFPRFSLDEWEINHIIAGNDEFSIIEYEKRC